LLHRTRDTVAILAIISRAPRIRKRGAALGMPTELMQFSWRLHNSRATNKSFGTAPASPSSPAWRRLRSCRYACRAEGPRRGWFPIGGVFSR